MMENNINYLSGQMEFESEEVMAGQCSLVSDVKRDKCSCLELTKQHRNTVYSQSDDSINDHLEEEWSFNRPLTSHQDKGDESRTQRQTDVSLTRLYSNLWNLILSISDEGQG